MARMMDRLRYWRWLLTEYRPIAGAEDDPPEPDPEPKGSGSDPEPEPDPDPGKTEKSAEDLRKELRESDRVRKRESAKAKKRIEELERQAKEREDEDKSEQEKAVEAAREAGKKEAQSELDKQRREDRLEVATTRLSARGFKVGEGDDAETVKFADPDDALVYIQRDIASGTLDPEEVFDSEGKVQDSALTQALADLLERKPHLRAGEKEPPPPGDSDAGKGSGRASSLEEASMEEHVKSVQRNK